MRLLLAIGLLFLAGCDLTAYQTNEGIGVIGPNGGYFVCFDNEHCEGR